MGLLDDVIGAALGSRPGNTGSGSGLSSPIAMALMGYGIWSLVATPVVTAIVATVTSFLLSGWMP